MEILISPGTRLNFPSQPASSAKSYAFCCLHSLWLFHLALLNTRAKQRVVLLTRTTDNDSIKFCEARCEARWKSNCFGLPVRSLLWRGMGSCAAREGSQLKTSAELSTADFQNKLLVFGSENTRSLCQREYIQRTWWELILLCLECMSLHTYFPILLKMGTTDQCVNLSVAGDHSLLLPRHSGKSVVSGPPKTFLKQVVSWIEWESWKHNWNANFWQHQNASLNK